MNTPRPCLIRPDILGLAIALLLFSCADFGLAASRASSFRAPAILPVDSVRAGMVGVGRSVFEGTSIDSFGVTILGVLKGYRPGATLILARAHGELLERTGIIAGMSGSPVTIDGKLIGAMAYAWPFVKDPIAGITPIEEMLSLFPGADVAPRTEEDRFGYFDAPPRALEGAASGARPIATPLALAGFTDSAIRYMGPWLEASGFVASLGGAEVPGVSCDSMGPGSALAVTLVRGDWSAAAIGTVTYRDGDRILGFGHPFVAMGRAEIPLATATIHTVMASQLISNKIGSPTQPCGLLLADRSAGVAGEIGGRPDMIPVRVAISSEGRSRHYRFEVARSRSLTPPLVAAALVNSISEATYDSGPSTIRYDLRYHMNAGRRTVRRSDALVSITPLGGAGESVSQNLTQLLSDPFRPSRLDSVAIEVAVEPGVESGRLAGIRVTPSVAAPGESLDVELSIRRSSQKVDMQVVRIAIPAQTPDGDVTVRVCDADETERLERQRAPERFRPETFEQLASLLEAARRQDRLYVQIHRSAGGATVGRGEISQAPPSVLQVLGTKSNAGETTATQGAMLAERDVWFDYVVNGCQTATVTVLADRRR